MIFLHTMPPGEEMVGIPEELLFFIVMWMANSSYFFKKMAFIFRYFDVSKMKRYKVSTVW